jgi:drug/metabolite transporter (DMT)-like permease
MLAGIADGLAHAAQQVAVEGRRRGAGGGETDRFDGIIDAQVVGGLILLAVGALTGGRLVFYSPSCAFNLLYMGFISAGAYTLWGILLKYNPVSKVSILGFINPIMGVLLSALFLDEGGEAFSARNILALLLVCIGIVVVNFTGRSDCSTDQ